jgi:phage tail sheath gpL-like
MVTTIRQPSVSFSLANSNQDVQNTAQRILLVGQMTSAGTATAGNLVENIASTDAPENTLFGRDSE